VSIEKGLIGFEDINFGTDTFQRKSQSGQFIPITKIRASHIPVLDSAGRFTGTEVETALAECMTREESGSNVKKLTNRSGSSREAGDVVIIDTNNDNSFTTTTSEGSVLVLGVVLETIANLTTGLVATGGYVGSVKVTGATVRGDYLKTSTTVLKAVPSTFKQGIFAIALSNHASVVSAYIFGSYGAASGTMITNLNADMVDGYHVGNSTGQVPVSNGTVCTDLNADKIDGLTSTDFLRSNMTVISAYRGTSVQTITNALYATLIYNTENFDSGSEYDTATGEFTATSGGYYYITAACSFVGDLVGDRYIKVEEYEGSWEDRFHFFTATVSSNPMTLRTAGLVYVAANGRLRVRVYQSSGGNLNVNFGVDDTFLTIHRVR